MDKDSYVVFHNVAEFFSIMVSLSVFSVGWFTYDQSKDRHALFLSVAFLAVGLLDFMHTMSNAAMPAFLTPNSTNKSTQFWIAARLFDASAFVISASIYPHSRSKWLSRKVLLPSAMMVTWLVFTAVVFFPSYLPATAVQGFGLTPLKRYLEFLVILLLAAAAVAYWKRMKLTEDRSLVYYPAAFIICIFSEGVFASYKTGFDTYNVLGHIYKVAAFYLIYKGVFIAAVKAPYEKLVNQERIKHLASFPQLNPNPILETTSSGEVIFANPAAERLLDDLGMDRNGFAVLFPEDCDAILCDLRAKKDTVLNREVVIGDRVFRESIYLAPQFDTARIYAFEVTERKRAEEALQQSEIKYRSLFENMIDGFALHQIILDDTGKPVDYVFREVNSAFEKLTGFKVEDILNKNVTQVLPGIEEDPADWIGVYGKVALTGQELRFEQHSEPLGSWYAVSAYSPMPNHFATVFEDITDRKQADEALRQSEERYRSLNCELEARVRQRTEELTRALEELHEKEYMLLQQSRTAAMGEMINNIAHQWRQPLNSLGLSVQQLRLFYDLGHFSEDFLYNTVDNSMKLIHHMSQTIDDFRNFFRPDKERREFNVKDTICNALNLIEGSIKNMSVAIVANLNDELLIYGYPNEYAQVVLNVLSNAKDAFEERSTEHPALEITSVNVAGKSVVTIRDNAGGIPEDIIGKVFDPHFSTKGPKGTGIGLFMTKNIVERNMNGRITVCNIGDGAEFRIEV